MALDWSPLTEAVRSHQRFLLTTHVRPDGDGIGSMLALASALRMHGKVAKLVVASFKPPRYDFLDPGKSLERFELPGDQLRDTEVVLVLDTGTWNQLGDFGTFLRQLSCRKFVIDHHQTQDDLGAVRLVDTSAEATGRLIYEAIVALGGPLTATAAEQLFVALAMDTGWFRHSNTTAKTYDLASKLVAAGARPEFLYEQLFEDNTLGRLKLLSLILGRMQVLHGGKVAYTELYQGDYATTGAIPSETEDLVNFTRSLGGVEVGVFFMEQPLGGIKVSFRSRESVDVAKLAEQFGGGGHKRASGATIDASMEVARSLVLAGLGKAMGGN